VEGVGVLHQVATMATGVLARRGSGGGGLTEFCIGSYPFLLFRFPERPDDTLALSKGVAPRLGSSPILPFESLDPSELFAIGSNQRQLMAQCLARNQ